MGATILEQMIDRDEIGSLVNRLGVVLDEGRFYEMPSLLAPDATVRTPGGTAEGPEAITAQASRNHRPEQPIQHVITNLVVDLQGDRAQARANLVVHFGPLAGASATDGPLAPEVQFTLGEVYRFDLVRTTGGWRFSRIETVPLWMSGTPIRPSQPA